MDNERRFYTYAYLREDRTPYYIGKSTGKRAFRRHKKVKVPPKERILFLKTNLTEEEAFKHEIYMIAVFGRKDLGTGILWNFSDGGESNTGWVRPQEYREKIREKLRGRKLPEEHRRNISLGQIGRKASEESKEKRRLSLLGHPVSEEVREKLSQFRSGTIWITDGTQSKQIKPEEGIPEGWKRGRK